MLIFFSPSQNELGLTKSQKKIMTDRPQLTEEEEKWLEEQINQNDEQLDQEIFNVESELYNLDNSTGLSKEEQEAYETWSYQTQPHQYKPPCKFFPLGTCNWGDNRSFSHDPRDLIENQASGFGPRPCHFYKQGKAIFFKKKKFFRLTCLQRRTLQVWTGMQVLASISLLTK